MSMIEYFNALDDEETVVAMAAVEKLREEKWRQGEMKVFNTKLRLLFSEAMRDIGLEDTKSIVREAWKDLRNMKEEDSY